MKSSQATAYEKSQQKEKQSFSDVGAKFLLVQSLHQEWDSVR